MKYCLVLALVASTVALTTAAPGMRGNGASGATRDVDPENPNLGSGSSGANAVASGEKPVVSTYSEKKNGQLYSIAQAKNAAGSSAAQISPHGSSSSAVSHGGSAVASSVSSRGYSQASAASSGSLPGSGYSLAAVRG